MKFRSSVLVAFIATLLPLHLHGAAPKAAGSQLIVSIAPDWNSQQGQLQLFERTKDGWTAVSQPSAALYGKSGLAWGRGVRGQEQQGLHKRERDGRAPAGLFKMGKIYGHDPALPKGASYPFRQIGKGDAWIDDPEHPLYNQHVVVDPAKPPAWFAKNAMRHGDAAYRWLLEIRHNADPPVAGAGSAIFFHLRRGETRPSAGCTVMAEPDLLRVIRWMRADRNPHYVLLPWSEYQRLWKEWQLPPPDLVAARPG